MIAAPRQGAAAVVDRILAETRALILRTLLELVPREPRLADFYETVLEYPRRGSKAIRPALCLAACRAHGGSSEDAIGAATAIELMHSAFLVHDDICDGAARRRGGPALHVRHGLPLALTAGDALAWLALEPLLASADRIGGRLALDVLAELQHMTRRTIEGQAAELAARELPPGEMGPDDYLRVVLDKTCWYSAIQPCRIGALIGARGGADLDAIARFGFFLGAVLQIRDDIENVTDRDELGGKDFGGDVIEGKPTLMLIHLRGAVPPSARAELDRLVGPGVPRARRRPRGPGARRPDGRADA